VTYDENLSTSGRTGTITVAGGGLTQDVTVSQASAAAVLTVDPANRDVGSASGSTTFDVTSNIDWIVSAGEGWLGVSPLGGSGDGTITVTYDENLSTSGRTGTINLAGGGLTQDVTVSQEAGAITITCNLNQGWNWISSNVDPSNPNVEVIWSGITDLNIVKSYSGFYVPGVYNGIGDWNIKEMYKAHLSASNVLTIEGQRFDPDFPIDLNEGWNWVSYLPEIVIDAEEALVSIINDLNIAKSYDGFFVPGVYNGIGNMEMGKGYTVHTQQPCALVYPNENPLTKAKLTEEFITDISDSCSHFTDFRKTEDYQALLVKSINSNGIELSAGDEIGIYSESGILIGGAVVKGNYPLGMMAWMDDSQTAELDGFVPGEKMVIKYWHSGEDKEYYMHLTIDYGSEILGKTAITILSLEIDLLSSLASVMMPVDFGLEQNFPNPFNPKTTIRYSLPEAKDMTLTVYSINGKVVKILVNGFKQAGHHQVIWDGKNTNGDFIASGIYLYRMESGNFLDIKKMIFIK
jgi:hypothetical protein